MVGPWRDLARNEEYLALAKPPKLIERHAHITQAALPGTGRCLLGEGLFLTEDLVAWVDITQNRLYLAKGALSRTVDLAVKATVILASTDRELLVASGMGLGLVDMCSGEYRETVNCAEVFLSSTHRTNDGCKLSDGRYLIGTMHQCAPGMNTGAVFLIDPDGTVTMLFDDIYIPNTFVELRNGDVLITDSHTGTIFLCKIGASGKSCKRELWHQSRPGIAPDGGCKLTDEYIVIAMWDGACIMVFEESGRAIAELTVPAKRPTNVKFRMADASMWVTSACEGLTEPEMNDYPLSGKTFCVNDPLAAI
jgi:sugar lactone lactonase YvrE